MRYSVMEKKKKTLSIISKARNHVRRKKKYKYIINALLRFASTMMCIQHHVIYHFHCNVQQ